MLFMSHIRKLRLAERTLCLRVTLLVQWETWVQIPGLPLTPDTILNTVLLAGMEEGRYADHFQKDSCTREVTATLLRNSSSKAGSKTEKGLGCDYVVIPLQSLVRDGHYE